MRIPHQNKAKAAVPPTTTNRVVTAKIVKEAKGTIERARKIVARLCFDAMRNFSRAFIGEKLKEWMELTASRGRSLPT